MDHAPAREPADTGQRHFTRVSLHNPAIIASGDRQWNTQLMDLSLTGALLEHPGKVFSRAQLMTVAYADHRVVSERTIDSHVKNLRRKIEVDPKNPTYILTVHGVGYRFAREA